MFVALANRHAPPTANAGSATRGTQKDPLRRPFAGHQDRDAESQEILPCGGAPLCCAMLPVLSVMRRVFAVDFESHRHHLSTLRSTIYESRERSV